MSSHPNSKTVSKCWKQGRLVGNENRRDNDSRELRKLRLLLMMKQSKSGKLAQTMSISLLLGNTAQLKLFGYIVD